MGIARATCCKCGYSFERSGDDHWSTIEAWFKDFSSWGSCRCSVSGSDTAAGRWILDRFGLNPSTTDLSNDDYFQAQATQVDRGLLRQEEGPKVLRWRNGTVRWTHSKKEAASIAEDLGGVVVDAEEFCDRWWEFRQAHREGRLEAFMAERRRERRAS